MERVEIGSRLCVCLVWAANLVPAYNEDVGVRLQKRSVSQTVVLALNQPADQRSGLGEERESRKKCTKNTLCQKRGMKNIFRGKWKKKKSEWKSCGKAPVWNVLNQSVPLWSSERQMCASDGADSRLCWKNKDGRRPFLVVGPFSIYSGQASVFELSDMSLLWLTGV